MRVLIVDDDGATRTGLSELLTQAGYQSTAVATLQEAQVIMRTTPPDLLITDIRLEAFNGLQLVLGAAGAIPTIVITGFADPVLEAEAHRRGATYIVKPVDPLRLLDLVGRMAAKQA